MNFCHKFTVIPVNFTFRGKITNITKQRGFTSPFFTVFPHVNHTISRVSDGVNIQGGPKISSLSFWTLFRDRSEVGVSNFGSGRGIAGNARILKMGVTGHLECYLQLIKSNVDFRRLGRPFHWKLTY